MLLYSNVPGQPLGFCFFNSVSSVAACTVPQGSTASGGVRVKLGRFDVMLSRLRIVIGFCPSTRQSFVPSKISPMSVSSVIGLSVRGASAPCSIMRNTAAAVNCFVTEPMR